MLRDFIANRHRRRRRNGARGVLFAIVCQPPPLICGEIVNNVCGVGTEQDIPHLTSHTGMNGAVDGAHGRAREI